MRFGPGSSFKCDPCGRCNKFPLLKSCVFECCARCCLEAGGATKCPAHAEKLRAKDEKNELIQMAMGNNKGVSAQLQARKVAKGQFTEETFEEVRSTATPVPCSHHAPTTTIPATQPTSSPLPSLVRPL